MFEVDFHTLINCILCFIVGYLLSRQSHLEERIERINQYLLEQEDK